MPMPVHGARTTDAAFQTVAILHSSNAGPPFAAWRDLARRIHSQERPTGLPPAAGMHPTRQGAIAAPISRIGRPHFVRYPLGACARSIIVRDAATIISPPRRN